MKRLFIYNPLARATSIRSRNNFNSVIVTNELFRFTDITDPATGKIKNHLVLGTESNPIGILDFNAHCEYGVPKQITIRKTGRHWWLSFSYAHSAPQGFIPRDDAELAYELNTLSNAELNLCALGIDRNVKDNFVATSDGRFFRLEEIQKERLKRKEIGVKRIQRRMSKQVKGSKNRVKTKQKLSENHEYKSNVTRDFSHQTSHSLTREPASDDRAPLLLIFEALKIANMTRRPKAKQYPLTGKWLKNGAKQKAGLNKSILQSCWGSIATQVKYKAYRRSVLVLSVPAAYSSQECSKCSHTQPENRVEQRFICRSCGYTAHADTNAGKVIAKRGIRQVRDQKVIVKVCKRTAYKRRKPKECLDTEFLGREPSGVPVDARVSHGEVQTISMQQQMNQETSAAMHDAPTTVQGT